MRAADLLLGARSKVEDRRERGDIILDRRHASRAPIRFDVTCALGDARFEATARNLTPRSIFVETEEAVSSGASLELSLHLPDDEGAPAKLTAVVRRLTQRRDETPGFGAEFGALDEHTTRRIRAVLDAEQQRANGSP